MKYAFYDCVAIPKEIVIIIVQLPTLSISTVKLSGGGGGGSRAIASLPEIDEEAKLRVTGGINARAGRRQTSL